MSKPEKQTVTCPKCGASFKKPFSQCPACKASMKKPKYDASWVDEAEGLSALLDDDWLFEELAKEWQ